MVERTPMDRLQPCLLNRLTDDEPETEKESRDRRVVSVQRYKAAVLRDVENLLNSRAHPVDDNVYDFDEAARSVINYGIRDICGLTISDLQSGEVESQIQQALEYFEPRISSKSLSVRLVSSVKPGHIRSLSIEIEGRLWAQPIPDHLFVKTEVDVETGHCELKG
ncbi:MAG: type VI secretion system baseplate subunit TssE [Planctomycetota bacterium]|jgi:type VI secretion system protein ImpF